MVHTVPNRGDGVAGGCGDACVALGTIGQHCFQRNRSALCIRSVDPHAERPRVVSKRT